MGTRGAVGFRVDQKDFITYNHYDSYPSGLGADMVAFASKVAADLPKYRDLAGSLSFIREGDKPTTEDIARARELGTINLDVSQQSTDDWYCLMREAQGNPEKIFAFGKITDNSKFMQDSLFCEYAYIINFDTAEIEFYKGFNKDHAADGRYAALGGRDGYAGVRLVGTAPLTDIPEDWEQKFYGSDEEEDA